MTTWASLGPGLPDISLELSVAAAPATPVWQDNTIYLRSYERTGYGRAEIYGQMQHAEVTLVLDNRTRRFDPTFSPGPYFGSLKPLRRFRVQMRYSGIVYPRCVVYTPGWSQAYPGQGTDATVTLQCFDAFGVANLARFPAGWTRPLEAADVRLGACLDLLGIPAGERSLEAGVAQVAAVAAGDLDNLKILQHILDVNEAEGGQLFVNGSGVWTFQNRYHRNANERTVQGTFGDTTGKLPYRDADIVDDEAELWNAAQVTPASGTIQEHRDATSIGEFYERDWSRSLPMADEYDALARGQYVVARQKDPRLRCTKFDVLGAASPTLLWPVLLGLEISEQVVVERFSAAASKISMSSYVEGLSEGPVKPGSYPMSFQLSPADNTNYWVLGTSALGTTTIVSP